MAIYILNINKMDVTWDSMDSPSNQFGLKYVLSNAIPDVFIKTDLFLDLIDLI